MKHPLYKEEWPLVWKKTYEYDLMEIYGSKINPGYRNSYFNRFNSIINSVLKYLPAGSNILDIAAAQGNFSLTLAEKGYKVTWNDLRSDLADYVKLKYESGTIAYCSGDAFEINFSEKFDGVIITEIIEHVAHPDYFLKKVASLVKPGGFVFMSTPLGNYFLNKLPRFSSCSDPSVYEKVQFGPNSDDHIFLLYKDEIESLGERSGLGIEDLIVYNNPLTCGHIKSEKLLSIFSPRFINSIETMTRKFPGVIRNKIHSSITTVFIKH